MSDVSVWTDSVAEATLRGFVGISDLESWPVSTWPGCYPVSYVTDDGERLCGGCVSSLAEVHFAGAHDGWLVVGAQAEEGESESDVLCAGCGRLIAEGSED